MHTHFVSIHNFVPAGVFHACPYPHIACFPMYAWVKISRPTATGWTMARNMQHCRLGSSPRNVLWVSHRNAHKNVSNTSQLAEMLASLECRRKPGVQASRHIFMANVRTSEIAHNASVSVKYLGLQHHTGTSWVLTSCHRGSTRSPMHHSHQASSRQIQGNHCRRAWWCGWRAAAPWELREENLKWNAWARIASAKSLTAEHRKNAVFFLWGCHLRPVVTEGQGTWYTNYAALGHGVVQLGQDLWFSTTACFSHKHCSLEMCL